LPNFRLIVEYDGTDFEGWQVQPKGSRTVQGCIAESFEGIVGAPVAVLGSGRTDAGVHAEGQVASALAETRLDPEELRRALNAKLPDDIAVVRLERTNESFDPRRDALSKHYRYRIWNHPIRSPLRARRFWWRRAALDLVAMRRAAEALVGEHDFESFQATGSDVKTTVRRLLRVEIVGETGGEIVLDFEGDGFLRYMVRNLVGTLAEVGLSRRSADEMGKLLAARDRGQAGATAPALGLTLMAVRYPDASARSDE
jgi:tRNA pseudouridine38-40 synthase